MLCSWFLYQNIAVLQIVKKTRGEVNFSDPLSPQVTCDNCIYEYPMFQKLGAACDVDVHAAACGVKMCDERRAANMEEYPSCSTHIIDVRLRPAANSNPSWGEFFSPSGCVKPGWTHKTHPLNSCLKNLIKQGVRLWPGYGVVQWVHFILCQWIWNGLKMGMWMA